MSIYLAAKCNAIFYRGTFTLNEEDEIKDTGWYTNWTSGIQGITFLIVLNNDNSIIQLELNAMATNYCRIRFFGFNNTWESWKNISII